MNRQYLSFFVISMAACGLTACAPRPAVDKASKVAAPMIASAQQVMQKESLNWSYTGDKGPEHWGNVKNASLCKIGQEQSPINITSVTNSTKTAPRIHYGQSETIQVNNNGHTIVYTPIAATNTVLIDHDRFELQQFHYHTPSEHQFNGQNYPAEIHFVHTNKAGNLAVLSVMVKLGPVNDTLTTLLEDAQLTTNNKTKYTADHINLSLFIPPIPTFYHYEGSLTTPPCSEKVQWYVIKDPLVVSKTQLAILTALYNGNNRPIQPQGTRTIDQISDSASHWFH